MISVTLNGERRSTAPDTVVATLVAELTGGTDPEGIAVAVNRTLLPRAEWDRRRLRDGDEIEVIAPFQGG